MGSWNKTCALSNLSISAGQDIVVFIVNVKLKKLQELEVLDCVYPSDHSKPAWYPIVAKYDDYGGAEGAISNKYDKYLLDYFNKLLKDPNTKTDRYRSESEPLEEVKTVDELLQILEGNLIVKDFSMGESYFTLLAVHKDIYDDFVKVDEKLIDAYRLSIEAYSDSFSSIDPALFSKGEDEISSWMVSFKIRAEEAKKEFKEKYGYEGTEYPHPMYKYYFECHEDHTPVRIRILNKILKKDGVDYSEDLLKLDIMENVFSDLRRTWMPTSGEGSQHDNKSDIMKLNSSIEKLLRKNYKEMLKEEEMSLDECTFEDYINDKINY